MTISIERFLTVTELAEVLPLHTRTIQIKLKKGEIKGKKIGRKWVVSESNLREFLQPTPIFNNNKKVIS